LWPQQSAASTGGWERMVSNSSKQLCTARGSPTMGLPSRLGFAERFRLHRFPAHPVGIAFRRVFQQNFPCRVRLVRGVGLAPPEPAKTDHRLAFWAAVAPIFGTIAMTATLSVIPCRMTVHGPGFRLKAPYGSMTSTSRSWGLYRCGIGSRKAERPNGRTSWGSRKRHPA
jgi:hypothetical protein